MDVRTYYWDVVAQQGEARLPSLFRRRPKPWRLGNVGDLYNRDLVSHLYGASPVNIDGEGRRILLVGSTAHRALSGDLLAGVGVKDTQLPTPAAGEPIRVLGARGPLTVRALKEAGYDLRDLSFQLDPGILIGEVYPELSLVGAERNRVVFIPHYRERSLYRKNRKFDMIDVDTTPLNFAKEIASAEIVYSSSLHGIIFAHALNRPAVLVRPLTAEPELKYRDYYASIGVPWTTPVELEESMRMRAPEAPDVTQLVKSTSFPSLDDLRAAGIAN